MTSGVDLARVKEHVQVTFDDDDTLLSAYLLAAESHVANHTRRDLDVEFPGGWPNPLQVAVLLIAGQFYNDRSEASALPGVALMLLAPYREFT